MDNTKKAKVLLIWCVYFFAVVVFGGAINVAANGYFSQQFGHFLENFFGSFVALTLTLTLIVFFTALKMLKSRKRLLSDNALNMILAVLIMWIFFGALADFLGWICDVCAFKGNVLTDYEKGRVTITCLNFAGITALFIAVKFYKTAGGYFKSLRKNSILDDDADITVESVEDSAGTDAADSDGDAVDADKID